MGGEGNPGGGAGYLWATGDWAQGADDKQLGKQELSREGNEKKDEREREGKRRGQRERRTKSRS